MVDRGLSEIEDLPGLQDVDRAVLGFVLRLVLRPRSMERAHLAPLHAAGMDDRAAFDVVQVTSCFSYMNRLADGLGVTLEPPKHALARRLYGAEALAAHLAWGVGPGPA